MSMIMSITENVMNMYAFISIKKKLVFSYFLRKFLLISISQFYLISFLAFKTWFLNFKTIILIKIIIKNQPGILGGDLHVRVLIEEHELFERKGADLYYDKEVSLIEALTGFNFELTHLDGVKINVSTLP